MRYSLVRSLVRSYIQLDEWISSWIMANVNCLFSVLQSFSCKHRNDRAHKTKRIVELYHICVHVLCMEPSEYGFHQQSKCLLLLFLLMLMLLLLLWDKFTSFWYESVQNDQIDVITWASAHHQTKNKENEIWNSRWDSERIPNFCVYSAQFEISNFCSLHEKWKRNDYKQKKLRTAGWNH